MARLSGVKPSDTTLSYNYCVVQSVSPSCCMYLLDDVSTLHFTVWDFNLFTPNEQIGGIVSLEGLHVGGFSGHISGTSIDLSVAVVDCEERLRLTLAHEMCHAAQWVLDGKAKPPHGPRFWHWARAFERAVPGMKVSTCHSYDIFYKFRYECDGCGNGFGRQSKSVDLVRQRCALCHGKLRLLEQTNADGTPAKRREPSAFAKYVQAHYSNAKAGAPGASHKQLMASLGARWREEKEAIARDVPPREAMAEWLGQENVLSAAGRGDGNTTM